MTENQEENMIKSLKNIAITTTITIFIIILTLSLISYNPNDRCLIFYSSNNYQTSNYLLSFGANIAAILLYLFGSASWAIIGILILICLKFLNTNSQENQAEPTQADKIIALLFILPLLSTIFYKYKFELFKKISPGGILGRKIYLGTVSLFGSLPASILIFIITWVVLIIFLRTYLTKLINKLLAKKLNSVQENHLQEVPNIFEPAISTNSTNQEQYKLPELNLFINNSLEEPKQTKDKDNDNKEIISSLENKLKHFGINGKVIEIINGPVVKLIRYQPNIEIKVSQILSLEDDLALALKALSLRIIAPIPGQSCVGFEISNAKKDIIHFSDLTSNIHKSKALLPLILGKNSSGQESIIDLTKMPHLLIAGSTGSGKSSGLNSIIMSLLYSKSPEEVKLILIDPKRLEFTNYEDLPHLIFPIINSPQQAVKALRWVVANMEKRYNMLSKFKVKNIDEYHKLNLEEKIPYLIVIIDELADLMITSGKEIEVLIARIAQLSRAAGIHLIIATQRPSVDVITGIIKINFPSRIAFRVISKIDSRTILDTSGAEKLLGAGDMLFLDSSGNITRIHGAFVSNNQIHKLTQYIKSQKTAIYESLEISQTQNPQDQTHDEILDEVLEFIKNREEISISLIQRVFKIGFNRSASIIEQLELTGHIMPCNGKKFRKVIKLDKC